MGDSSALVAEKYLKALLSTHTQTTVSGKVHTLRTHLQDQRTLFMLDAFFYNACFFINDSIMTRVSKLACELGGTKNYAEEVAEIIRGHVLCDKARIGSAAVGQTKKQISAYTKTGHRM